MERIAYDEMYDDIGANNNQGSVYVFDWDPSNQSWAQTKITASDGAADDNFGGSVAIAGNHLAVGSAGDDVGLNADQGSGYLFQYDPSSNTWAETKFTATDGAGSDAFGSATDVSDSMLAFGAPVATIGANALQGAVYLYRWDPSALSWQQSKISASDGTASAVFGTSISISGMNFAVGNMYATGLVPFSGAAYLYEWDPSGNSWNETKLYASDGANGYLFGLSVSLSGKRLLVGCNECDIGGTDKQGAAYLYEFDDSSDTWQETKFTISTGAAIDRFGKAVAISGNRFAVGASGQGSGVVYIYQWDPVDLEWERISATSALATANFGSTLDINGSQIVVGSSVDESFYFFEPDFQ